MAKFYAIISLTFQIGKLNNSKISNDNIQWTVTIIIVYVCLYFQRNIIVSKFHSSHLHLFSKWLHLYDHVIQTYQFINSLHSCGVSLSVFANCKARKSCSMLIHWKWLANCYTHKVCIQIISNCFEGKWHFTMQNAYRNYRPLMSSCMLPEESAWKEPSIFPLISIKF